jgi:hypothetical protein
MTRMQQVEDAVREDDLPLRPPPGGRGLRRTNLSGGVQSGCDVRGWKENVWLNSGSETDSL